MPLQLRIGQSQIRQTPRNARAGVIHDDDEIRAALELEFLEGRRFVGAEQPLIGCGTLGPDAANATATDQTLHGMGEFYRVEANAILEHELNVLDVLKYRRNLNEEGSYINRPSPIAVLRDRGLAEVFSW